MRIKNPMIKPRYTYYQLEDMILSNNEDDTKNFLKYVLNELDDLKDENEELATQIADLQEKIKNI